MIYISFFSIMMDSTLGRFTSNRRHHLFLFIAFIVFTLVLIIFKVISILILLIFINEVIDIGSGLFKFHDIHSFTSVPMKESLLVVHFIKVIQESFHATLNGSGIRYYGTTNVWIFQSRVNFANAAHHSVRNPLYKLLGMLITQFLDIEFYITGTNILTSVKGWSSKDFSKFRVTWRHEASWIEHLSSNFGHIHLHVSRARSWGQRGLSLH